MKPSSLRVRSIVECTALGFATASCLSTVDEEASHGSTAEKLSLKADRIAEYRSSDGVNVIVGTRDNDFLNGLAVRIASLVWADTTSSMPELATISSLLALAMISSTVALALISCLEVPGETLWRGTKEAISCTVRKALTGCRGAAEPTGSWEGQGAIQLPVMMGTMF